MNAELQSEILNRDARGTATTLLMAKTKDKKANTYNIFYLDGDTPRKLVDSLDITDIKERFKRDNDFATFWLLGYSCRHVKIINLSSD